MIHLLKQDGATVPIDGPSVSEHISFEEWNRYGSEDAVIFEPLLILFETVRKAIGRPIAITSGYRSLETQQRLYKEDLEQNGGKPSGQVAKPIPGHFPHGTGAAMDIAIPYGYDAPKMQKLFQNSSCALGFKMCRTGREIYKDAFLHVDVVYLLYEPFTDKNNPLPDLWKPGVKW